MYSPEALKSSATHEGNTRRLPLVLTRTAVCKGRGRRSELGEDAGKPESSYMAGGKVNLCSHWKITWQFLKKLNLELPYDPTIPLLVLFPKQAKTFMQ